MDVFVAERKTEFTYGLVNSAYVKEINFVEEPDGEVLSRDKVVVLDERFHLRSSHSCNPLAFKKSTHILLFQTRMAFLAQNLVEMIAIFGCGHSIEQRSRLHPNASVFHSNGTSSKCK